MIKRKSQQGQALLIFILLSTVLATIAFSIAQSSVIDNQNSELELQTKRAFSAAEAGIEAALKRGVDIQNGDLTFPGIKSLTAIYSSNQTQNFTTSIIDNNQQYTFYLSSFDPQSYTFGQPLLSTQLISITPSDLDLNSMCNSQTTAFAVEMTFINTNTSTIFRKLIDHCNLIDDTLDEWQFDSQTEIGEEANVLVLRMVGVDAGFNGARLTITNPTSEWPIQSKTITSTAQTTTNVVKKIRLISSYPQVPVSFFVPSF